MQLIPESKMFKELSSETASEIVETLNSIKNGTNSAYDSMDQYLTFLKEKGEGYVTDYVKANQNQVYITEDVIQASKDARAAQIAQNEAVKEGTLSFKAGQVALKGLALAGNMVVGILAGFVISKAIEGLDNLVHAADNAKESAEGFVSSFSSMNDEFSSNDSKLSDLQKQYDELSKGVNSLGENVNLTTDEYDTYKQVISEISDIMPNLLARYDDEGNKIGFVQGKLSDLNAEYDKYKKNKAMDLVNGENDNGDSIKDVFRNYGYQIYHDNGDGTITGNPKAFGSSNYEKIVKLKAQIKYGDGNTPGFGKLTNEEIEAKTALIQKYQSEIDASVNAIQDALSAIAQSGDAYYQLSDQEQQFLDTYISSLSQTSIQQNGLDNEITARAFINNLINDIESGKPEIMKAYNDLFSFDIDDTELSPEEVQKKIDTLVQQLAKALGENDWQDLKIRLGFEFVDDNVKDYQDTINRFNDPEKIKDFFDTEGINTSDEINQFNDLTEGITNADEAIKKYTASKKQAQETSVSSPQSFIEAWQALDTTEDENLKNTKKDLLDLAEAGQLSANTLKSVQGAEDYFKAIGLSAQEASNKVNELVNSSQQLSSMRSGITSITGALDTKASEGMVSADKLSGFDVSLRGLETWDKFEETMGDTNSSMEDCKKAANELATEYVNSNNFLSQLTDTNKDYYISQLENMGVTNATEVVNASLVNSENALAVAQSEVTSLCDQQTDAKKKSYAASIDLSNATAAELQYLYNEANASGVASSGLRQLLASKLNANNVAIASAADCTALAQIYTYSERTKQSLLELAAAKRNAQLHGNGGGSVYASEKAVQGKAANTQREIDNANKQTKVDVNVGGGAVSNTGGGGGSKSKSKSTKTEIDWLERAMTRVGNKIDKLKSKLENLFTVDTKSDNISKQLKLVEKEMSIADKQVSTYKKKADKVKLSKKLKTAVQEGRVKGSLKSLIAKYGEKTANRIQTYQNWYDKAKEAKKTREELIRTQRELQEQQYQLYVDDAQANIDKLNAQKDISAGYTAQNQKLDDQINYIKTSYEYQIKIAELTKDENKKAQLQAELTKELRDLEKEKFENIKEEYSSRISLIDAEADAIQSQMDQIEARGQIVGASYYESQIAYKNQDKAELQAELSSLQGQLTLMEQAGDVGTKNWYDAKSAIADVQKQITDCDTSILNMNNSITEVANTIYDKVIAGMKKFSTEADFMVGLMDDLESFDELSHTITDVGLANLGSYFTGKESSAKQAATTKSIVEQMKKNLANGDYSYTDALGYKRIYQSKEQMQDAIDSFYENWRDQINQTKEYNSKIIDFMRNKLQEELAAVQDLIDSKKEALSAEKSLRDYQKSIRESTKSIGTIQAQITALQGDSSESAQARIQALQSQLEDAQDDLAEKQYERQISDEQDMLDNMYNKYSDLITAESQDTKALIEKGQKLMDSNMKTIKDTMDAYATDYGYSYETLTGLFDCDGFTKFAQGLNTKLNEVKTAIGSINIPSANNGDGSGNKDEASATPEPAKPSETIQISPKFSDAGSLPDVTKNPLDSDMENLTSAFKLGMSKKQVNEYIKKNAVKASKKKSEYGAFNQAIYENTSGKILSDDNQIKLAKKLGVSTSNHTKKSGELYKALKSLKIKGFSKGGLVSIDSLEKQVKANGDDGLISAQNGELVLKPYDSELFKSFMQSDLIQKPSFANNLVKANLPDFSKIGRNTGNNVTNGDITFEFNMPNVTDSKSMLHALQTDKTLQNAVQDLTIGQINRTSRLGINKYR